MSFPNMVDLEALLKDVLPEIDRNKIFFNLTRSEDGLIHPEKCSEHQSVIKSEKVSLADIHQFGICQSDLEGPYATLWPMALIYQLVDSDLVTAVQVMAEAKSADFRKPEDILSEVNSIDDVVALSHEYLRFQNEVDEQYTQLFLVAPDTFRDVLDPVLHSLEEKINSMHPCTLGHPKVRSLLATHYNNDDVFDFENVNYVLRSLYLMQSGNCDSAGNLAESNYAFALACSWADNARWTNVVSTPLWVYNIIKRFYPDSIISKSYTLNEVEMHTARSLWTGEYGDGEENDLYKSFDECVRVALTLTPIKA